VRTRCLTGRRAHPQQFCMSLATAPASAVFVLVALPMDFSPGFNESEVGTVEFSYLKGDRYGLVGIGFRSQKKASTDVVHPRCHPQIMLECTGKPQ